MVTLLSLPGWAHFGQYGNEECGGLIRLRQWLAIVRHD
jgi:hypothetical protein